MEMLQKSVKKIATDIEWVSEIFEEMLRKLEN